MQHLNRNEEDINIREQTQDDIIASCGETLGYIQHNQIQQISEKDTGNHMRKTTRQGENIECNNPETIEECNRIL